VVVAEVVDYADIGFAFQHCMCVYVFYTVSQRMGHAHCAS